MNHIPRRYEFLCGKEYLFVVVSIYYNTYLRCLTYWSYKPFVDTKCFNGQHLVKFYFIPMMVPLLPHNFLNIQLTSNNMLQWTIDLGNLKIKIWLRIDSSFMCVPLLLTMFWIRKSKYLGTLLAISA